MSGSIDGALLAALGLTRSQLEQTDELQVGYLPEEERFEVVVRYHGELKEALRELPGASGEVLTERYAILILTKEQIYRAAALSQIEYVEKPKALLASDVGALRAACIPTVQLPEMYDLHGRGTLIGILDSGIDYLHPAFITENGESRIAALWDQTQEGQQFFTKEEITNAIRAYREGGREAAYALVPSRDVLGHGTQAAGAAAGNGRGGDGRVRGVADEAELIVVKLAENRGYGFTRTTAAMRGLKYAVETAQELERPIAVNLSMGTNMGGHNGDSLFETYIDDWSRRWINSLVVAAGNEGAAGRHAAGRVRQGEQREIEVQVGERGSVLFQIWKAYGDQFYINVGSPGGENTGFIREGEGGFLTALDGTWILIYYGNPDPYSGASAIYINLFAPRRIQPGLWRIYLQARTILDGRYDIWMTGEETGGRNTYFLIPEEETTITMPVTAESVIGVAAYNHTTGAIAPFSGRGYSRDGRIVRPSLAAPGVGVLTALSGGGYGAASGTSIASPIAAGAAALMLEWGYVRKNDLFLYGERLKAFLTAGAERDFGMLAFPNRDWGYGRLCLSKAMRELTEREFLLRRAESVNCRDAAQSEEYIELVFPKQLDGGLPFPEWNIECLREISNNDLLAYVRAADIGEVYPWEYLPMLYGLAAGMTALDAAGVTEAQELPGMELRGTGVVIGVVDTGIDYLHPAFRAEDGRSRILSLWDQSEKEGEAPAGYVYGREYLQAEIDRAIQAQEEGENPYEIVAQKDEEGHGTYVAGVAAGTQELRKGFSGTAPEAELIVVKLKEAKERLRNYYGIPAGQRAYQHTDIQQGISYVMEKAGKRPVVILLALSASLGAHDGSSGLENALEQYRRQSGTVIVCAAGNQGDSATHASGTISAQEEVEFFVDTGENVLIMTVWMHAPDQFSLSMVTPRGHVVERIPRGILGPQRIRVPVENTVINVEYLREHSWNGEQAAVIRLERPSEGLWRLYLYGDTLLDGTYDIYMPLRQWLRPNTRFLKADPAGSVTMPGTAASPVTVGGYNHLTSSLYPASGRGPTRLGRIKPDVAAPSVGIYGPVSPDGYQARSGTSSGAAIAAGGCAQILEWAITYGNQPGISPANIKALLYRGAVRRPEISYPNNRWGYGQLNILRSLENG